MLAKRTFKNQITIPKQIMERFGAVEYFDIITRKGEIVLRPVEITPKQYKLDSVRDKIKALGIRENDINEAIKWVREKKR